MNSAVIILVKLILAFLSQSNAVCNSGRACYGARDTIEHRSLQASSKAVWIIQPSVNRGNILLAFKNFQAAERATMELMLFKFDGSIETRAYRGRLLNFEVLARDTWLVLVNATAGVEFKLQYYADCQFTTATHINSSQQSEDSTNCYILAPTIQSTFNRIYVTVKEVRLGSGWTLKIQDVHSSQMLASYIGDVSSDNVLIESNRTAHGENSYFILVELSCSTESCDSSPKQYTVSQYAMVEKDIWCIEVLRFCLKHNNPPSLWCNRPCPALTEMAAEEYGLKRPILPVGRSRRVKKRGASLNLRCPSPPLTEEQCSCSFDPQHNFCKNHLNMSCFQLPECQWRCIVSRILGCTSTVGKRFV